MIFYHFKMPTLSTVLQLLLNFCRNFKFWDLSGAKECKSCRSRRELSNEHLIAKIGFDLAEKEPFKVWITDHGADHIPSLERGTPHLHSQFHKYVYKIFGPYLEITRALWSVTRSRRRSSASQTVVFLSRRFFEWNVFFSEATDTECRSHTEGLVVFQQTLWASLFP